MEQIDWKSLSAAAWNVRARAFILGNTAVGAAVLTQQGLIFSGCNVEHRFRCHDIHAEVNAISSMVAAGHRELIAILIAAERERFTPCGGCMDWIFQFGSEDTSIAFQRSPESECMMYRAAQLMPHYPQ